MTAIEGLANIDPALVRVECAIYRGGTSRALMFKADAVPGPGEERDALLIAAMGSPHVRQIDGLGGGHPVTSKAAIVGRSTRSDADLDYTFAQVDIERARVDYTGVCGNVSAAVAPFALDSGLITAEGPVAVVRIYNTNTRKILIAEAPLCDGRMATRGDFAIDGVPGTGPRIFLDYSRAGGILDRGLLPTGATTNAMVLDDGSTVTVSICDLAFPTVFIAARDCALTATDVASIEANAMAMGRMKEVRGRTAELLGLCDDWREAGEKTPVMPLLIAVAPSNSEDRDGEARALAMNRCHESMPGSGALCLAAAASVPGSIVHQAFGAGRGDKVRIGHPGGVMEVEVSAQAVADEVSGVRIVRAGISRTARAIMSGTLFLPSIET